MRKKLARVSAFVHLKRNRTCSKFGIPKRLWKGRRKKDDVFSDDELIFRRFTANLDENNWKSTKGLSTAIFDIKDDSTNRSKYSEKVEDVLYPVTRRNPINHYQSYGVVVFSVKNFRSLSITPKEPLRLNGVLREFTIHLEHRPERCMYPHTEIWVHENGNHIPAPTSRMIKTAVRDELLKIIDIAKFPLQST